MNHSPLYGRLSTPLESGCQYEGDWKDGKPHGSGRAEWPDGWIFEGEFEDGRPKGGNLKSPGLIVDHNLKKGGTSS